MLYLREMDEDKYSKICAVSMFCLVVIWRHPLTPQVPPQVYFSTSSDLHGKEMKTVFMSHVNLIKVAATEDGDPSKVLEDLLPFDSS